jgi:hypothetical protein
MHNVSISNFSYPNSSHFPYLELLVINLWRSFHISLFIYIFVDSSFFIVHIHCYVFMKSRICIAMLYISLIWCWQFRYVHLDMHIFSRFTVFKFLGQNWTFRVSKLPFLLHPLSHGFIFVTLKFCGNSAKIFNAFKINCFYVFEPLRFQFWALSV